MNGMQEKLVDFCECHHDELTEWEQDFITSIREKLEDDPDYPLSDKQNRVLNRINTKLVSQGFS